MRVLILAQFSDCEKPAKSAIMPNMLNFVTSNNSHLKIPNLNVRSSIVHFSVKSFSCSVLPMQSFTFG